LKIRLLPTARIFTDKLVGYFIIRLLRQKAELHWGLIFPTRLLCNFRSGITRLKSTRG